MLKFPLLMVINKFFGNRHTKAVAYPAELDLELLLMQPLICLVVLKVPGMKDAGGAGRAFPETERETFLEGIFSMHQLVALGAEDGMIK